MSLAETKAFGHFSPLNFHSSTSAKLRAPSLPLNPFSALERPTLFSFLVLPEPVRPKRAPNCCFRIHSISQKHVASGFVLKMHTWTCFCLPEEKKVYAKIVGRSRVGRSQIGTIIRDNASIFWACRAQLKLYKTVYHSNRWRLWSHPILINPKSLGRYWCCFFGEDFCIIRKL